MFSGLTICLLLIFLGCLIILVQLRLVDLSISLGCSLLSSLLSSHLGSHVGETLISLENIIPQQTAWPSSSCVFLSPFPYCSLCLSRGRILRMYQLGLGSSALHFGWFVFFCGDLHLLQWEVSLIRDEDYNYLGLMGKYL